MTLKENTDLDEKKFLTCAFQLGKDKVRHMT